MQHDHEHYHRPEEHEPEVNFWKTAGGITLIFFLVVGGYFLIREHSAHIGSNWIWLVLLACLVMHKFMHGGHNNKDEGK